MVEQPSNKQVEQRKETSATARRRFPPAPRLPSPSTTPATYTVALESVSEALDGLRNHARAGRTGCAHAAVAQCADTRCANLTDIFDSVVLALSTNFGTNRLGLGTAEPALPPF